MEAFQPTEKTAVFIDLANSRDQRGNQPVLAPAEPPETRNDWLSLLKLMVLLREIDRRQSILVRQGQGGHHISSRGHEALMAIPYFLKKEDYLFTYYRSYHLFLAKGLGLEVLACDFLGKATSSSGGRSVSAHANSRELNIFPSNAPTGSQCLPATGVA